MVRWLLSSVLALGLMVGGSSMTAEGAVADGKAKTAKVDGNKAGAKAKGKGKKGKRKGKKGKKGGKKGGKKKGGNKAAK